MLHFSWWRSFVGFTFWLSSGMTAAVGFEVKTCPLIVFSVRHRDISRTHFATHPIFFFLSLFLTVFHLSCHGSHDSHQWKQVNWLWNSSIKEHHFLYHEGWLQGDWNPPLGPRLWEWWKCQIERITSRKGYPSTWGKGQTAFALLLPDVDGKCQDLRIWYSIS